MTRDELVVELEKLAATWAPRADPGNDYSSYGEGVAHGYNRCLGNLETLIAKAKEA